MGEDVGVEHALREFFSRFFRDEGSRFALDLMLHYATGRGAKFVAGQGEVDLLGWSQFMIDRPEIEVLMREYYASWVPDFAFHGDVTRGQFVKTLTKTCDGEAIRLYDLPSMRLTLHGCHKLIVYGEWHKTSADNTIWALRRPSAPRWCLNLDPPRGMTRCPEDETRSEITLYNVHFMWVDRGDLHGDLATELESGDMVKDEEFEKLKLGQPYWIEIRFKMPGMSIWRCSWHEVEQLHGWPPSRQTWYEPAATGRSR